MVELSLGASTAAQFSLYGITAVDPLDATNTIRTFHFDLVPMAMSFFSGTFLQGHMDNKFNEARGYEVANKTIMQKLIPFSAKG